MSKFHDLSDLPQECSLFDTPTDQRPVDLYEIDFKMTGMGVFLYFTTTTHHHPKFAQQFLRYLWSDLSI